MKKVYFSLFILILLGTQLGYAQKFTKRMEIPDLYDRRADTLTVDIETHDFGITGLNNVETFAYNHKFGRLNDYLGPSLTWYKGEQQSTYITNNLPDTSGMRTTVHWHGANIPAYTDGGPHQFFDPGNSFDPSFTVLDNPTTLWYHPHAEDLTYTQVQMGLAGIIIVREQGDPVEAVAPSTYGHDDIPLIIQDIYFKPGGEIDTTKSGNPGGANPTPRTMLVNGTIQPYLEVPPQPVNFRILNGSTRNGYMLAIVRDTMDPENTKVPLHLFMSDGGYLPDQTVQVDSIETGPGIRNGIIVDFGPYADSTLYVVNLPGSLDKAIVGSANHNTPRNPIRNNFLQIRVGATQINPIGAIPASLPPLPPIDTLSPDTTRIIRLTKDIIPGDTSGTKFFGIDDQQYDFDKINTVVKLNTIEDWTIVNASPVAHPFHIHLIQFYVMKVVFASGDSALLGDPNFPPQFIGPKDNILVHAGDAVTFRARFHTYAQPMPFNLDSSAYMYHCHILTHEDGYYDGNAGTIEGRSPFGMMQQFAVWDGTISNVAIDEPLGDKMIFYPNPAEGILYLNGESPKMSTVRIIDLQGRLLMEKVLPPFAGSTPIDVSEIARGMILVEWSSPDAKQIKKIVLE